MSIDNVTESVNSEPFSPPSSSSSSSSLLSSLLSSTVQSLWRNLTTVEPASTSTSLLQLSPSNYSTPSALPHHQFSSQQPPDYASESTTFVPLTFSVAPSDSPFLAESSSLVETSTQTELLCRLRRKIGAPVESYFMPREYFNPITCSHCARYLFNATLPDFPDPENATNLEVMCDTVEFSPMNCERWKSCCFNAVECCNSQIARQQQEQLSLVSMTSSSSASYCPQVWDGFSCVPPTTASTTAEIACPVFLNDEMNSGPFQLYATRTCTREGEWAMYGDRRGGEYTDYVVCAAGRQLWDNEVNNFRIICEVLSIVALASSIFCFVYCRQLRKQKSYKVHTQMFAAMLLHAISCLLRDTIVHHFTLSNYFPPGCETITMLVRHFMITAYCAMSVEAFYLHWNLASAYNPVRNLLPLFLFGWSVPFVFTSVYVGLRVSLGDPSAASNCWIQPWGNYEWIIFGPNFACLAMNLVFLVNVFRITCAMQAKIPMGSLGGERRTSNRSPRHPCEVIRRPEFRAMITFTLLFGIPQALVLIRANGLTGIWFKIYEMASVAMQMLQGMFASILLCYLNVEVRTAFVRTALGIKLVRQRERYESIVTGISTRVRSSIASLERRSRIRSKDNSASPSVCSNGIHHSGLVRTSADSGRMSHEMTPMLRSPLSSTTQRYPLNEEDTEVIAEDDQNNEDNETNNNDSLIIENQQVVAENENSEISEECYTTPFDSPQKLHQLLRAQTHHQQNGRLRVDDDDEDDEDEEEGDENEEIIVEVIKSDEFEDAQQPENNNDDGDDLGA